MGAMDEILALHARRGDAAYFGEAVSIAEHGQQAAHFAREDGADDALVIAALLHDVGHLIADAPDDIHDWHEDAQHERTGAAWLAQWFDTAVTDPVRLHVAAKRFLCATAPSYFERLSPASVITLKLQGGPMTAAEVDAFRTEPHFREAIRLRLWDERGKVPGLATRKLAEYRGLVETLAAQRPG